MRVLPLTVLAWEGPQARAYLVRMARAGLRPERILLLVSEPSRAGKGLPSRPHGRLMLQFAERLQDAAHNYHPYRLAQQRPELVRAIAGALAPVVPDPLPLLREMYEGFSFDRYADVVTRVAANSYKDPSLVAALSASGAQTVLFTGGGIVPRPVFDVPGIRLIHVHTGLLPFVRGADVLLWSLLARGRPGVSAFFMTPGLDDGAVLAVRELPPLRVRLEGGRRPDDETLYRTLFSFLDPLLRAELLVADVLAPQHDLRQLRGEPQDLKQGVTYHFMHPSVRQRALSVLFVSPPPRAEAPAPAATRSPAKYQGAYERRSALMALRLRIDALRERSPLRALSLKNRARDYRALAANSKRRALLAELNRELVNQAQAWPNYDYGEGWFYQSSDELGITGLRDTSARIAAYRLSELLRGRRVLEIGCNTGFLSLALAPAAQRIVAFELNPHLIAIARIAQRHLGRDNVAFETTAFEGFRCEPLFDDVLSFANHHTYDGNTQQSLEQYFARCHALTRPGGRLIFESHPPELEGHTFGRTLELIERFYTVERSEVHDYGTFLDRGRRFLVALRR
jgi:SAM-dependent methyltransferase